MIYTALRRKYIDQKKRTNNDLHNITQTIYWPKEKDKQWSTNTTQTIYLSKEKDKQWFTQHYTDNILINRKGQTMIYITLHRQYIDQKKRTNNDLHSTTLTIYWSKEKDKQWSTQHYTVGQYIVCVVLCRSLFVLFFWSIYCLCSVV
jgi:hypothetical protein